MRINNVRSNKGLKHQHGMTLVGPSSKFITLLHASVNRVRYTGDPRILDSEAE